MITTSAQGQYSFPVAPLVYNSDSVKVIPASVFPLGALITGDAGAYLDSPKKVSINTITNFNDGGGQDNVAPSDTLGWVGGGSGWIPDFRDYWEKRMYFFSGKTGATPALASSNRQYDFGTYNNFFQSKVVTDGNEASVSSSPGDTLGYTASGDTLVNTKYSGKYVLRSPVFMQALTGDTNRMAHYFDFMYRFNTDSVTIYNSTDTLYMIEIWVRGAKDASIYTGNTWKLYDTILYYPITKAAFLASDSYWQSADLEHELRMTPQNVSYQRFHIALSQEFMRRFNKDGFSSPKKLTSLYPGEDCYLNLGNDSCSNQPGAVFF